MIEDLRILNEALRVSEGRTPRNPRPELGELLERAEQLDPTDPHSWNVNAVLVRMSEMLPQPTRGDNFFWKDHLMGIPARERVASGLFQREAISFSDYISKLGSVKREDWLIALESGDHKQVSEEVFEQGNPSSDYLDPVKCVSMSTCCIGVLPKIAGLPFQVLNAGFESEVHDPHYFEPDTDSVSYLLDDMTYVECALAVHMNDALNLDFSQIAAVFRWLWNIPKPDQEVSK